MTNVCSQKYYKYAKINAPTSLVEQLLHGPKQVISNYTRIKSLKRAK
jgi:hypothetical protein